METPKIKRVPEFSSEYQFERNKIKEYNQENPRKAFGEFSLEIVDQYREDMRTRGVDTRDKISKIFEDYRQKLRELYSQNPLYLMRFIDEIMSNSALREKISRLIPNPKFAMKEIVILFVTKSNTIDNDLLEEISRFHVAEFKRKSEEFKKKVPELVSNFKEIIGRAVSNGWLPVNLESVDKRIQNETTFTLFDELIQPKLANWGDYNVIEGVVRVRSTLPEEDWSHVVDHELVHSSVSGRAIIKNETKNDIFGSVTIHQKLGLGFNNYKEPQQQFIFSWLNEAVTEGITILLCGGQDSRFYVKERNILKDLISEGMSQELILQAYCETEVSEINGVRVPAWKKFIQKLSEIKGGKGVVWLHEMDQKCAEFYKN